ncbi:MAG: CDP-2,3-bis-(O-geranylgeranyl)-sn-glycerol synthase [Halobacteria archaeon]
MSVATIVAAAIWLMLPAYIPNNAAVIFGGGTPVDFGRKLMGDRILGDGKTFRGAAGGIIAGFVVAAILNFIQGIQGLGFLPAFSPVAMVSMPAGAILGDMTASFVKRRSGRERGAPFPVVDQLDFVVGAWFLTVIFAYGWFTREFTVPVIVAVLIITPALHISTNFIGYHLGFKDEPW